MDEISGVYKVLFPFYRGKATIWDEEGNYTVDTWCPGVRVEGIGEDVTREIADGQGFMILSVVSVHKPGKFPSRVFFTRQWEDPDGKIFGKGKLHIATLQKFRRISRGYAYPGYDIAS